MDENINPYQNNQLEIRKLLDLFINRKTLIAVITGFFILLFAIHGLTLQPIYTSSFELVGPNEKSQSTINEFLKLNEIQNNNNEFLKEQVNSKFLLEETFYNNFLSFDLQKNIFLDGGYLNLLNKDVNEIDSITNEVLSFTNSINVRKFNSENRFNDFHIVSFSGKEPKITEKFLKELVDSANIKTIQESIDLIKNYNLIEIQTIRELDIHKVKEINEQIEILKIKTKRERLNQIERIKEKDAQKLREINDQINRARYKAKESRLNQIVVLTESAKLARSLGMIDNNFKLINDNESNSYLTIAIGESMDLPEWYLYGEKALLQKIKILGSRNSDDPFIPELVVLKNQLNEVQNNNLLRTLEARQDDVPFIPEIVNLNKKLNEIQNNNLLRTLEDRLNKDIRYPTEISSIEKRLFKNSISPSKTMRFIAIGFIIGLMVSFLLVLVIDVLIPGIFRKKL